MRMAFSIALLLMTMRSVVSQTWHSDEAPLPLKISSIKTPRRIAILAALRTRIAIEITDGSLSDLDSKELAKAEASLHALDFHYESGGLLFVAGWDQPLCGGVGNCPYWILDEHDQVLLETHAKAVTILSSSHHNRPDLLFSIHDSASDTDRERWYFDGKKYKLKWCGTTTYGYLGHERTRPYTYSHPCTQ